MSNKLILCVININYYKYDIIFDLNFTHLFMLFVSTAKK